MRVDDEAPAKPKGPTARVVRCPRCRKSTRYDPTNEFRPFCSALCKNEDIIAWAEQGYCIPGPSALPTLQGGDDDEHDDGEPRPLGSRRPRDVDDDDI
jgi:endogenous inhibitor of DNA gyrase (YacG/DUF329 family)